jgi:hypothetical protein
MKKTKQFAVVLFIIILLGSGSVPTANGKEKVDWPLAEGTFIQKELVRTWDDAKWQSEFQYLREAGMKYIVLAPTAYSSPGAPTETIYPSDHFAMEAGYPDLVDNILRNAQKAGFKVFLGLNFDSDWWRKSARDPEWLYSKMQEGNIVADELYNKYHNKYEDTFYGWYWVWEVDNLNYPREEDQEVLAQAININLHHVKELNKEMPFMLCPFMNAAVGTPEQYKQMWVNIFKKTDFAKGDIFCPQDSVGAGGLNMENFVEWFKALREAVDTEKGLEFWSDAETFDHHDWSSAPIKRFVAQLQGVQPYVDHIITFAYSHYYSPNVGKEAYHKTYVDYVKTGKVEDIPPSVPGDLRVTDSSANSVRVQWAPATDNMGVVGYRLYRNDTLLSASLIPATFFVDRSVQPETDYVYRVSAVDAAGNESAQSAGIAVHTGPVQINLAKGKTYTASIAAHPNYPDTGGKELTDGIRGGSTYADPAWQGRILQAPYSITVDLAASESLSEVSIGCLQDLPTGVQLPQSVTFYVSEDNQNFTQIGSITKPGDVTADNQTVDYKITGLSGVTGRYVKVEINDAGSWSFIDELEVR